MNELQIFNYEETTVRTIMINGEPWWVLADVCRVLDISNSRNVAARLRDDEKGVHQIDTLGGTQEMTIINEPGLYKVILRSNSPKAEPLMDWITHEVLPSIRKTGAYIPPKPVPELPAPQVATAKRILAQCAEIQAEAIPDRPETKLNAMKTVKNLLKDNGFNAPSIVVDPTFHSEESDLDMVDFVFNYPKEAPTDYESYLASLLIPRLEG